MDILKTIRNYFFYCGIEKDEYDAVKRDAYISNFNVWRFLHILIAIVFGILCISALLTDLLMKNGPFYLLCFIYSLIANVLFAVLKKDSIIAQLLIYLTISMLLLFGGLITQNNPEHPATIFIVFLLVAPLFMIDKPFFMAIELCAASTVFLIWMYYVKPFEIWQIDFINVVICTIVGIFLNVIANSIRIREFVLTRKIRIQKDTDELTGLKNKSALTRAINEYLEDDSTDKGTMFILDIDHFKSINDTYGHDVGDSVIHQIGQFLGSMFTNNEIVGRFGGDEFIIFIEGTNDPDTASQTAANVITGIANNVSLPNAEETVNTSIGIALYNGSETNYSEIFKKADVALYKSKADPNKNFYLSE